jgi:hypothetical protein
MPTSPRVVQNEIDVTFSPATPPVGISLLIGECKRGPAFKPDTIFTSFEAFRKVYGGLIQGNNFPHIVKRAIERGSAVRIVNVKHMSNVAAGTLAATNATAASSSLVNLSGALGSDNTITVTVNGTPTAQAYVTSSNNTLQLLVDKLKLLTGVIEDAYIVSTNAIVIVPKAGVALVTTVGFTGTTPPTGTVVTEATFEDGSNNTLFSFTPKYPGADYNNVMIMVSAANNGDADAFDITIKKLDEPDLTESYPNLKIVGKPTVNQSTYLKDIADKSQFLVPVYNDLSGIVAAQITPRKTAIRYQTGTDAATDANDYIGALSSKSGLYAADAYSDMAQFCIPNNSTTAVIQAASAYAAARKDLEFFAWLGDFSTEAALATARDNTLIDSSYTKFFAGTISALDPFSTSGATLAISPMGDICGIFDFNDAKNGPWISAAGRTRGKILNALGVTNNFGTPGNYVNLNMLSNRQINLIVNESGTLYLKGNFTGQRANSAVSYGNVRRFLIHLKKTLGPFLEKFLEDPNDIPTWKAMYLQGFPTMDNFVEKRALFEYVWDGDQFARSINELKVNNANDVGLGKYKLRMFLKVVVALQEITLDVILTPSGVSFEDNLEQLISQL